MSQHSKMAAPSLAARLSMTWRLSRLRAMPSSPTAMIPVWMMSRIRYIPGIYLEEIRDKKVVSCHFSCKVYVIKIYTSSPNPKFTTSSMILPSIIYNKVLNFRKCRNYRRIDFCLISSPHRLLAITTLPTITSELAKVQ